MRYTIEVWTEQRGRLAEVVSYTPEPVREVIASYRTFIQDDALDIFDTMAQTMERSIVCFSSPATRLVVSVSPTADEQREYDEFLARGEVSA